MGNLGWYQTVTSIAKKVGGPRNLLLLTFGAGAGAGAAGYAGARAIRKGVRKRQYEKRRAIAKTVVYTVYKEGKSNEGLLFKAGDQFRVLEKDGDAVLIEKLGDPNNPYFVSGKFLSSISDYKCD